MCTLVLLRRPGHDWPLLLAGNRDEMADRPWLPPGRHWPLAPDVIAGQDLVGEGSWLGLNEHGVTACLLNRTGSLGPAPGKRTRGVLVLLALDYADAADAALALERLNPRAYRPFNLVIADNRDALWLRADGRGLQSQPIPEGLSMLTAGELNDLGDPRIGAFLPRFRSTAVPEPALGDWRCWQALLGERASPQSGDPESGLTFQTDSGFCTGSSALIALPGMHRSGVKPCFLFAAGPPDRTAFFPLLL